jgi:hypothetical protein
MFPPSFFLGSIGRIGDQLALGTSTVAQSRANLHKNAATPAAQSLRTAIGRLNNRTSMFLRRSAFALFV